MDKETIKLAKKKIDILIKQGYRFHFVQATEGTLGEQQNLIVIPYNIKDNELLSLLDRHINPPLNTLFKVLSAYVNSKKIKVIN